MSEDSIVKSDAAVLPKQDDPTSDQTNGSAEKPSDPVSNGSCVTAAEQSEDQSDRNASRTRQAEAPVKAEYLLPDQSRRTLNTAYVTDQDRQQVTANDQAEADEADDRSADEPKAKKLRGMNKNRRTLMKERNQDKPTVKLCSKFAGSYGLNEHQDKIEFCDQGERCRFSHDVDAFLATEPSYFGRKCPIYDTYGFCGYGLRCKFAESHMDPETHHNQLDESKFNEFGPKFAASYKNFLPFETKQSLRKKKYDFSALEQSAGPASMDERQWSSVDFRGKLYLAPLTTVGNLPFRRVCKEFGADITCGEMAMAQNIVEGSISEWALLRRHATEDVFGVQLCGSNQQMLTKACKLVNDLCDVDFIDINMGCPIDMVYRNGAGSGMMTRSSKVSQIVTSMTRVSQVPITIKMRTGVYEGKMLADKLISSLSSQFKDGRLAAFTIHGRSRESRYTKQANWSYVHECAKVVDSTANIPVLGSGDILSYEDFDRVMNLDEAAVGGAMIARGALIKPWIFTEIKERRHWDISSAERFDILQRFVNYGLEQWGSDHEGVEKTRRFLLEWQSFLYRYIPVGLLEVLPQKINDRPPLYQGRDDLETLFASPYCEDWIKISEMLLGPVKPGFFFLPKHKANAYA
jgi:tRNA-dihydrouridine synthase 3